MALWSWMRDHGLADTFGVEGARPLNSATTLFNVFQVLVNSTGSSSNAGGGYTSHAYGTLMDAAVALLIVTAGKFVYHFLMETWPSWCVEKVKNFFGMHTSDDAAAVDAFRGQAEEYAFDNELLVLALERYVSYLLHLGKAAQQGGPVADTSHRSGGDVPPLFLRAAEYRYGPVALPCGGRRKNAAQTLQQYYRLAMLPADGYVMEVEPGLTVCFQQQAVPVSAVRAGKTIPRRGNCPMMENFIPINFDASAKKRHTSQQAFNTNEDDNFSNTGSDRQGDVDNADDDDDTDGDFGLMSDVYGSYNSNANGKKNKVLVRQAILQCTERGNDGKERILAFARRAYEWYIPTVVEPSKRYYFYPTASELELAVGNGVEQPREVSRRLLLKRFALSSTPCGFCNLFFEQKPQLLALLEDFKLKQGKFALPGVPYQLVILLHGMPGTGKSSIVHNVAAFLDRHIVAVPIEYIQTNSVLQGLLSGDMETFNEREYNGYGGYSHDSLGLDSLQSSSHELRVDQTVFLFEDIESVSDMVSFQLPLKHKPWRPPSFKDKSNGNNNNNVEKVEKEDADEVKGDVDVSHSSTDAASGGWSGETNEGRGEECCDKEGSFMACLKSFRNIFAGDFLSPEGLLGALDATLAPPGRIIIFTTCHLERLPALFSRPGVVTLTLHLGPLAAPSAVELIKLYCGDSLTPALQTRFEALFAECGSGAFADVMSPAALVQVLATRSDAEEVLDELEKHCQLPPRAVPTYL